MKILNISNVLLRDYTCSTFPSNMDNFKQKNKLSIQFWQTENTDKKCASHIMGEPRTLKTKR